MKEYKYSANYDYPLLAELYDHFENFDDDIQFIRSLIKDYKTQNILELFSGTGRILMPLAEDGHLVTGIEIAKSMNDRALLKIKDLNEKVTDRITLKNQDVLDGFWGTEYDLIIIGNNGLYELPSAELQEKVIGYSYEALKSGGRLYIDCSDYKGDWGESEVGKQLVIFEGTGTDQSYGKYTAEGLMYDYDNNALHTKRTWFQRTKNGESYIEYLSSKHPLSAKEIEGWLNKYNFQIIGLFGSRNGEKYSKESDRTIFWAEKK